MFWNKICVCDCKEDDVGIKFPEEFEYSDEEMVGNDDGRGFGNGPPQGQGWTWPNQYDSFNTRSTSGRRMNGGGYEATNERDGRPSNRGDASSTGGGKKPPRGGKPQRNGFGLSMLHKEEPRTMKRKYL